MKIAVIPARGGSKRIQRKNIKDFFGKPVICWSIDAAKKSGLFDHIILSTDDDEIASIGRELGVEVPFMRPSELSDDHTATVPVIAHATNFLLEKGWDIEYVCCIYPCSPFLQYNDLISSFDRMKESDADFIYPVVEYTHNIHRAMHQLPNGQMQFLKSNNGLERTQDLEGTYHDSGQFYWGKASAWVQHKKMHTDGVGMIIPSWRVVDIDTEDDWKRAEIIFNSLTQYIY